MRLKLFIRGLGVILLILVFGSFLKYSGIVNIIDQNWVDINIRNNGLYGFFLFALIAALLVTFGFPRQIVSFLAGYAFGLVLGTSVALVACAIGCCLAFFSARLIGRNWLKSKFPERIEKADRFFSANTFVTTVLIRFMPAGSNFITNLVAGVSGASATTFISASTIGYIPQTLIIALLGSGFNIENRTQILVSAALFAISIALGLILYRKYKNFGLE